MAVCTHRWWRASAGEQKKRRKRLREINLRGRVRARAVNWCQRFYRPSAGPSPTGGQLFPAPPFEHCAPHFTFGPLGAAYIQYSILKMCPPFRFLAPPSGSWPLPAAKSWRRACPSINIYCNQTVNSGVHSVQAKGSWLLSCQSLCLNFDCSWSWKRCIVIIGTKPLNVVCAII